MATAEEFSESTTTCIASSSSSSSSSIQQNWWNNLHADQGSLSSWNKVHSNIPIWHQNNPINNSTTSCINCFDEDVSMSSTNASNHSAGLMSTVQSGRRQLAASSNNDHLIGEETSDNHLWSHMLLNVGSNGDLEDHQHHDVGDNFLEPACNDFLKKLDQSSNWEEFTNNSTNFNSFSNQYHHDEKKINGFTNHNLINIEKERLTKLSKLVSTLSISTPDQREVNSHFINNPNISLANNSSIDHYLKSSCDEIGRNKISNNMFPYCSYGHDQDIKYFYGVPPDSYNSRNSADLISFNSRLAKPFIDIHHHDGPKPSFKPLNFSNSKKQGISSSSQTRISGRGQGIASEGKKKRIDQHPSETTAAASKRPKQESCTDSSSAKIQAPKVKLGDKITALQQIVSPFGKTDTASVLYEAIQHIKFLHEQIQMLSIPYIKPNAYKNTWGSLERKDKGCDVKLDLRSRGLCLVPLSCAPQDYRDNTGSDYWTPVFRGRLYR